MLVSEVNNSIHFAFHFLAINEDGVTSVRNLNKKKKRTKIN